MAAVTNALDPSWINAPGGVGPSYDAEELRRLQGYQLAGGATAGTSRTGLLNPRDLALSLSGSNVMVGAGGTVIGTAKGAYVCGVAATTTIGALLAADVTNPRRDRVVLEILDPDNGGGAGRKAQLRIIDGTPNALAATGGGFPAAPTSPFIDLGYVDVPKSGAGSPSLTVTAPITAAAGAPIPVRTNAELQALPKWQGAQALVIAENGSIYSCNGTSWVCTSPASGIPYTPVWAGANNWGSSASASGLYWRFGDRVRVQAKIYSGGSGVNLGLANIRFSLPPGLPTGPVFLQQGTGMLNTANLIGQNYPLVVLASAGQSDVSVYASPGPAAVKTPGGAGYPWAADSAMHVVLEYQTNAP